MDKDPTTKKEEEILDIDRGFNFPKKLARLRYRLYWKAKKEGRFRFYTLFDRIYRKEVLDYALTRLSRKRDSAAGIDGVRIYDIVSSEEGRKKFIDDLHEELRSKRYKASPILRRYIPKGAGKLRPLGIPTVKDRVVQAATALVISAIFEADFKDLSYGYRPKKSANDAVNEIRKQINSGKTEVYDADLKGFFDNIPHDKLLKAVKFRISDKSVIKLIKQWLEAPIIEPDQKGAAGKNRKGTPQGGVISPLLANIYMHWFDHQFLERFGNEHWRAKLIRYADDFVIVAFKITDKITDWVEKELENRFGLPINREKTSVVRLRAPNETLSFLGYTMRCVDDRYGRVRKFALVTPSKKSEMKLKENLRDLISHRRCYVPMTQLVQEVNRTLRGWANYFRLGYKRKSFRRIDKFVNRRLYRHSKKLSHKHYRTPKGVNFFEHLKQLGLVRLNAPVTRPSNALQ